MKRWPKSLRLKLVSYFSLLSFITVSGVGILTFLGARVVITRLVFDRLRVTTLLKEDALNLWLTNQKEATLSIAQLPDVRQYSPTLLTGDETEAAYQTAYANLKRAFNSAIASRPELAEVFILSEVGGEVVISTQDNHEGEYRVKDTYFQEGLDGTYIQKVYPSPVTGQPTITISTPLRDAKGEVMGVLAAHLNLEQLDRIVQDRVGLGGSGKTYLVDGFNTFVSGDRFGKENYPRGVHSQGIKRAIEGQKGGGLYPDYTGVPVIGYYAWIDPLQVALLVEINQREAFQPARHLALGIFIVGSGSVFVFTGGVYWLTRKITRPILAIKDTAIRVASGDFKQLAPVMTEDEVGILAKSFNKMTERLQQLYSGLEEKVQQLELAEMSVRKSLKELEIEQARSERLLLNTLPQAIAHRLKGGEKVIAEHYEEVTVLFADIVNFTEHSERLSPKQLVEQLNVIFSVFDQLSEKHEVEKIKTIGDAYMGVGGLPKANPHHAEAVANLALEMLASLDQFNQKTGESFNIRIGI
ncbi:MAG: HAMP domain-containing protein, partial [Kamptonema sp. SIO4C4]|nr:HAMP domain-containing protein [Kamptonema sp. SIO4C4]